MATYGTDLVVIATGSDGESGTWGEFVGWASGGTPGAETENFIQGTQSQSQTFGNPTTGKSIAFDAGSDVSGSIPSGDVVLGWVFMGAPTNMYSYASGGHRFGIGASLTNFDMWYISGDDRAPNPYGGWWNIAVDPRATTDATGGTGSAGAWRHFGSLIGDSTLGIRVKISKGNPHAVDGLRMGRGEIYCTGTGATFTLMAAQNDLVANRWGLLQDTGGDSFLWKGLMSIGQSGTSATFTASNQNIKIDDAAKTYLAFNKIEIRHASTSCTWNNISFSAAGTLSPGQFEMVENATFTMNGGAFNNMDSFVFLSNGTLTGVSWNGCGQITHGGATFANCNFSGYEGTADTSQLIYNETADPDGELDGCKFTMGTALTHAIEFGLSSPTTIGLTDVVFSGYSTSNNVNNSAIHIKRTSGTVTINVSGGSGTISYRTDGAAVVIVNAVTVTVTAIDANALTPIEGASLVLEAASGGTLPAKKATTIATLGTTATATCTAHGLATGDTVIIRGANEPELKGTFVVTVTGVNTFTYTIASIGGSPGTGTITTSAQILAGITNASGVVTTSGFPFSTDQPVVGVVRKGTTSPVYKFANVSGTITSTGFTTNAPMVGDGA